MIIDTSPMSSFLVWALYLVGIPAIILSILVAIKVTRSFFGRRDYNLEIPADQTSSEGATHTAPTHEDKHNDESTAHRPNSSRDAMNPRMIQSG